MIHSLASWRAAPLDEMQQALRMVFLRLTELLQGK
jgi:hypothetical protein